MNTTITTILIVLFGLAVGSFMCVIIDRLPVQLDVPTSTGDLWDTRPWSEVMGGTSRCSTCGAGVRPRDNIPILGWLLLKGRCRDCGAGIPSFHPAVEFAVPALSLVLYWQIGPHWELLPALWLVPLGVAISVIDLRTMIVPTRLVWPAFFGSVITTVIAALASDHPRWLAMALVGAIAASAPLFMLWYVLPTHLGFGDVRLSVFLGWHVGLAAATVDSRLLMAVMLVVIMMTIGSFTGVVLGVVTKVGFGRPLPFGPTLFLGTFLCVAWAPYALDPFIA